MDAHITLIAGMMVLAGLGFAYWKRKRRFDRTNEAGVERFPSYRSKLTASAADVLIWAASFLLGITGLVILAFQYVDSWGWIVLLPLVAWSLFSIF